MAQVGGATLARVPDLPGLLDAAVRERLVEAARLAAVGRLMPSLAHQLATPLAAIALRAESLELSSRMRGRRLASDPSATCTRS